MGLLTPKNYHRNTARNMVYPSTSDLFLTNIGGHPILYADASNVLKDGKLQV